MAESKGIVLAALFANAAIAVLKFGGFLLTGSSAMLSETYHSISDTGNQVFLLIGIRYGERERSRSHPFGYGKAEFFYSFLVSVFLFGIAGWESAKHGYDALAHHEAAFLSGTISQLGYTFPAVWVNYAVLLGGMAFEAYAFSKAYEGMRREMDERGWTSVVEWFRKTSTTPTLTALTEDTVALAGLAIALVGLVVARRTGDPFWDGLAALLIGVLLMGFALALAWENKRLLIGESLPGSEERALRDIVRGSDGVTGVVDFRTVLFGPGEVLVTADVAFDPALDADEINDRITAIEEALVGADGSVRKVYIEPET